MNKIKREPTPYRKREETTSKFIGKSGGIITVVLVGVFICLQVIITNLFSENGSELRNLESRRLSLEKTNEQLRGELAALGSLNRIKLAAVNNLKMAPSTDRLDYLVVSQNNTAVGSQPLPATLAVRQ